MSRTSASKLQDISKKLRHVLINIGSADLLTFTEEIFNKKLHFLCSLECDLTKVLFNGDLYWSRFYNINVDIVFL